MKYCPNCGKQIPDDVRFCNYCGAPVPMQGASPEQEMQSAKTYLPEQDAFSAGEQKKSSRGGVAAAGILIGLLAAAAVIFFLRGCSGKKAEESYTPRPAQTAESAKPDETAQPEKESAEEKPVPTAVPTQEPAETADDSKEESAKESAEASAAGSGAEPAKEPQPAESEAPKPAEPAQTPAPEPAEPPFTITQEELEKEIEWIRTCYYTPGDADQKYVLDGGWNGWSYSRDYRFHDGKLIFAFLWKGQEEHRLYFKDGHLIRYIDENHVTHDFGQLDAYDDWYRSAGEEAESLVPGSLSGALEEENAAPSGGQESSSSADPAADAGEAGSADWQKQTENWHGVFEGEGGEPITILSVDPEGVLVRRHVLTASGESMVDADEYLTFRHAAEGDYTSAAMYFRNDPQGGDVTYSLDGNVMTITWPEGWYAPQTFIRK